MVSRNVVVVLGGCFAGVKRREVKSCSLMGEAALMLMEV